MDWTEIVVALIGFVGLIAVNIITANKNHQKQISETQRLYEKQNSDQDKRFQEQTLGIKAELSRYEAVNNEKITELTKQVEKHNGVIERVYELEKEVAVMKAKGVGSNSEE